MRLGRILIIVSLLLILVFGLIFALTTILGSGGDADVDVAATELAAQLVDVVMLSKTVTQGQRLNLNNVEIVQIQNIEFMDSMFTDTFQVEGFYARGDFEEGTVLTSTMLVNDPTLLLNDLGSTHAVLIPPGMVAFPIPMSRFSSLGYGLSIGDRVNVIATIMLVDLDSQFQTRLPNNTGIVLPPGATIFSEIVNSLVAQNISQGEGGVTPQGRGELDNVLEQPFYLLPSELTQRPRIVSQTVMFNRLVLHVGTFSLIEEEEGVEEPPTPEEEEAAAAGEPAPPPEPPEPPDLITLIVTPQESVTLNYLLYSGAQINMALRPPTDEAVIPTDAVTLQYLLDVYRIPVPVKLPYGLEPRVDILEEPILPNDDVVIITP